MENRPIRLIISDIDGTILDDQHRLDSDLKEKIKRLKESDIPFALASARSPRGIEPIAQELGLDKNPLACYNGALIIKGNPDNYDLIAQHALDKKEMQRMISFIKQEFPQIAINLYTGVEWRADRLNKWVQGEADITGELPTIQPQLFKQLELFPTVHKILLIDRAANIQKLYAALKKEQFKQLTFYLSKENYLEVTARQVSKELALVEIARYYELPLEAVMAIGDHFNDLPMLELAGLGVAMGNAPQEIKERSDAVTLSNKEHGVALALEKYILKDIKK